MQKTTSVKSQDTEEVAGYEWFRIKKEGAPMHPDDMKWHPDCKECQRIYQKQLLAYMDYMKQKGP